MIRADPVVLPSLEYLMYKSRPSTFYALNVASQDHSDMFVELRLLIVKHILLRTMEQCWEETMPPPCDPAGFICLSCIVPIFVWESYLRCLTFQILYNELGLHRLYKLPKESIFIIYLSFVLCWYSDWSGISILYWHW